MGKNAVDPRNLGRLTLAIVFQSSLAFVSQMARRDAINRFVKSGLPPSCSGLNEGKGKFPKRKSNRQ